MWRSRIAKSIPTNSVDVTLHTGREIIIDHLPHALEIHTPCHDFCTDHYPALAPAHPTDSILALFPAHTSVKAVDVGYAVKDQFLGQGRRPWLRGGKDQHWWIVRLSEITEKTGKFGGIVSNIGQGLGDER